METSLEFLPWNCVKFPRSPWNHSELMTKMPCQHLSSYSTIFQAFGIFLAFLSDLLSVCTIKWVEKGRVGLWKSTSEVDSLIVAILLTCVTNAWLQLDSNSWKYEKSPWYWNYPTSDCIGRDGWTSVKKGLENSNKYHCQPVEIKSVDNQRALGVSAPVLKTTSMIWKTSNFIEIHL